METKIEDLELNDRCFNALKREGINTLEQLKKIIEDGTINKVRNLNLKSIALIKEKLEEGMIMGTKIEDLELNVRCFNALKRAGINTLEQLKKIIEDGTISKVRNLNLKSIALIKEKVEQFEK